MPIIQQLISHDELISQLTYPPIIVNDICNETVEERDKIRDLISTRYSTDTINTLPSCMCGELKGVFSVGLVCNKCKTMTKSQMGNSTEYILWFRRPEGVEKLINPHFLIMLMNRFKKSGYNIIKWLMDPSYRPQVKTPDVITSLVSLGMTRGYNNFVENFDHYLEILFNHKDFKAKSNSVDYLYELYKRDRNKLFADYIPLPNKSLLIIEETNVAVYVDPIVTKAIDAIQMLVSIDKSFYDQRPKTKENRTAKALLALADFFQSYYKTGLDKKTGQLRKHIFSTRCNFTARAVVTSITEPHKYDEFWAPWNVGPTTFRFHLMNKLYKRGWNHNDALELLSTHINKYHPLIDELLQEIINESPEKGIVSLLQRNPSLLKGSVQRAKITKFKPNPDDKTFSISILNVKHYNGDFDGDNFNIKIAVDNLMADSWKPLKTHYSVFQLTKPHEIHPFVFMPKPVVASMSEWMDY